MEIADYIGVGGPVAAVATVLGFLLNSYIAKRKDDREEVKLERESETGIVETTKSALAMVRDEMKAMRQSQVDLRIEKDAEIAELRIEMDALREENRELRKEVAELRGHV